MGFDERLDKYRYVIFSILVAVFVGTYIYVFDGKIDLNGDNANYYMLGKALHTGEGYINLNSISKTPNNHFPPGYPFIISWTLYISDSFVVIKILNGAFALLSLFITFYLVRMFTAKESIAWLTVLFMLFNAHLLKYSTMMMTEIPFLFFSLAAVFLFARNFVEAGLGKRQEISNFILAFICMVIAFYIRTLGIALLAAFCFILLLKFRKRWMVMIGYVAGFVGLYIPWFLRGQNLGGNSYLNQLLMVNPYRPELGVVGVSDFISRTFNNLERYVSREIVEVLFPLKQINYLEPVGMEEWLVGVPLLVVVVFGISRIPKMRWVAIAYLSVTMFVLLIWPDVWVGIRFILPLLPFLLMGFFLGFESILTKATRSLNFRNAIPLWITVLLLLLHRPEVVTLHNNSKAPYEAKWNNYFSLAKGFKREGVSDVVVSCRKPTLFYLFSGTYTTNYKYTNDDKELIRDLIHRRADYVVLEQLGYSSTMRYLYPAIQKNQELFQVIAKLDNPETYLLRFTPELFKDID